MAVTPWANRRVGFNGGGGGWHHDRSMTTAAVEAEALDAHFVDSAERLRLLRV